MAAFTAQAAEHLAAVDPSVRAAAWTWQVNVNGPMSQYECGATWIDFSPELVRNLGAAWDHGEKSISYEFQKTHYTVDLEKGVQTNKTTGTTRHVRRVFVSYPWPPPVIPEAPRQDRRGGGGQPRAASRSARHSWEPT